MFSVAEMVIGPKSKESVTGSVIGPMSPPVENILFPVPPVEKVIVFDSEFAISTIPDPAANVNVSAMLSADTVLPAVTVILLNELIPLS